MDIIYKKYGELVPYENNPRKNDGAVDAVAASIKEFGWKVPVIIDKDNVVVAGHTRIAAARLLGLEEVPAIRADDLTDEQIKAYRIADNATGELAGWDFRKLETELEGISQDMAKFGFHEANDNDIDIAQESMEALFTLTPRITLASVALFALSNVCDVSLYEHLRKKSNGKRMWLRNNLCTMLCNGGENFLFYIIAFAGLFGWSDIVSMSVAATVIEVVIALCDTPFLYWAKRG